MKKIIIMIFTTVFVMSCNLTNNSFEQKATKYLEEKGYTNVSDIRETVPRPKDVKVSYVGYARKNQEVYRVYIDFNKDDKIVNITDIEDKYFMFEKSSLSKYKSKNITDVFVIPYAKGIDIILTTNKKDFTRDEFNMISKDLVNVFKKQYNLKDAKISTALELRDSRKILMIESF